MSVNQKPKGLFLNPSQAQCSIYESGKMAYQSLLLSDQFKLDYLEIDEKNRTISNQYDFYLFNYHIVTMSWLNTTSIRRLPGIKMTLVLEALPNDPFVLCPAGDFDAYCVLDPTMNVADKRVYAFPRPLENPTHLLPYRETEVPTIGTFGFATPGKGFELVVDAVNKEFNKAVIRINIPLGTYVANETWRLHKKNYAEYIADLCKKVAKNGIKIVVTHDYLDKDELINWCAQNTLNCFLYNRIQPGLSATTDQAISSGRPLAVSANETFRHIHTYLTPYPYRSLRESIALSIPQVMKMQKEWSTQKFYKRFEKVLEDFNLFSIREVNDQESCLVQLDKKSAPLIILILRRVINLIPRRAKNIVKKLGFFSQAKQKVDLLKVDGRVINNGKKGRVVLIVSHKEKQCGIHQYGINISEALSRSKEFAFIYQECSDEREFYQAANEFQPEAIIYNYYPKTMPWLNKEITRKNHFPNLGIMHEVTQEESDHATQEIFDYHLCPDPTIEIRNPHVFKTKRLIPAYINTQSQPDGITIGSFGFGFGDKGFERLVETVQIEFDQAKIFLHMPFNDIVDKGGKLHALKTARRCRSIVKKSGIKLVINHQFLSKKELLDFLAGNTLNAFFYDVNKHRGISSVIEHALAVQRPIAITKCGMFRHVFKAEPSIFIEDSSLTQIINNGIVPLVPYYNDWSRDSFIKDYEAIIGKILTPPNNSINI